MGEMERGAGEGVGLAVASAVGLVAAAAVGLGAEGAAPLHAARSCAPSVSATTVLVDT